MFEHPINDDTFLLVAMRHYDNVQCTSLAEFEDDLRRFVHLKKLFRKYEETGVLRERLIINHIVVLCNLFGVVAIELLFFKTERSSWDTLATFLLFLGRMPHEIPEFGIKIDNLNIDSGILESLKEI